MATPARRLVYTDGACSGNPGPGGWAWALGRDDWARGHAEHTTNQRMEITAAFEAVRTLEGPLEVRSDSTYVVNCFNQRWHVGWRKKGWRNSQRQPVANRDLWEPFIELVEARGDVVFSWVKGHSGDPMNDLVDGLAVAAVTGGPDAAGAGAVVRPAPTAEPPRASAVEPEREPDPAPDPGQASLF